MLWGFALSYSGGVTCSEEAMLLWGVILLWGGCSGEESCSGEVALGNA
ncbi:MAG TPA: hypothetical protein PLB63_07390 [Planctomycetota bacterium]|nr:hypothetical protein [Planctomycetota bacterium]HQB00500.1 hypothetical protein [Planctomycetota bacterium]